MRRLSELEQTALRLKEEFEKAAEAQQQRVDRLLELVGQIQEDLGDQQHG